MSDDILGLLAYIALSLAISLVTFWGLGGLIHRHFYVRRREQAEQWKLQPRRFLAPHLVRHSFWLGGANMLIGAITGGWFTWHVLRGGWSMLYFDPLEHGVVWLVVSAVAAFFVIDAGLYYSHRFMHAKFMFRHVHRWHHRYTAPVIFTTTAMHPVEFMFFQFFVLLPALVLPIHWLVYVLVVGYTYLVGMIDHSGIDVRWPLPLHSGNKFHDDHHIHFHCNYGHHTQLFDRLHGTVRRLDRRYGEDVYGGRGAPLSGEPAAEAPSQALERPAEAGQGAMP